jgi:DNA-binding NarL/FixJ family response regulator
VRVVVVDDSMLIRAGVARLLGDHGVDVVGEGADAAELHRIVAEQRPDAAVVDIRMPPTFTDEGIVAAHRVQREHPGTGVVVLSQFIEPRYAQRLLSEYPSGLGYLLKERVTDIAVLIDALQRVCEGECVLDPTIVRRLMDRAGPASPVRQLSPREGEVLALIAEGKSNAGIARTLFVSERTVEAACASIFRRLGLDADRDTNRRVLAVRELLRSDPTAT